MLMLTEQDELVVVARAPEFDDAAEAIVERYYVELGAQIQPGQAVALLRTERFVYELPAETAGLVAEFVVPVGGRVEIGGVLLHIMQVERRAEAPPPPVRHSRATPLARTIARRHGIDLEALRSADAGGLIRAAHVLDLLPAAARASARSDKREAHPAMEMHIAAREQRPRCAHQPELRSLLVESTLAADVPRAMTALGIGLRRAPGAAVRVGRRMARHEIEVEAPVYVLHAAIGALLRFPAIHSRWSDDGIVMHRHLQLGISFDGRELGAVLADALDLSPLGLARHLAAAHATSAPSAPQERATFAACFVAGEAIWREPALPVVCGAVLCIGAPHPVIGVIDQAGTEVLAVQQQMMMTLAYDARYLLQADMDRFLGSVRMAIGWMLQV